jgi:hypothetical protein
MSINTKPEVKSSDLSEEEKKTVMIRCFRMVDYLSDVVTNYILDFIQNVPCGTAKQFLLNKPEEFAIRAFEKAINDIAHASRRPRDPRVH